MEGKSSKGHCKIRKRRCSSSSSSSLIQKYRFKRAILVGKKGGSSTPVPTWKTTPKSPSFLAMPTTEFSHCPASSQTGIKAKEVSVSARKLAATLWEINKIPSTRVKKDLEVTGDRKVVRNSEKITRSSQLGSLPPHLSDPCHSFISEKMDGVRRGKERTKASAVSQKFQITDSNFGRLDSLSTATMMEIETPSRGKMRTGCIIGVKTRLKDVSNGLTTSKELLKVLSRIWGQEEQHSSSISVVSALRVELDRARLQVDQLIKEQRSNRNEIEHLMKHFAEEKAAWKSKERDRIRDAIARMAEELEVEKKLRRQTERLNKKLGKELADTKASLSKKLKELESEKRAKEILEQVCDELARGIGEDRAEVEELKRESAKVMEEMEKEREMLQLADVLREERVQMKLSEAKYHFEEKNEIVERLRNELETYLNTKIGKENGDGSPNYERIKELEAYLRKTHFGLCQNEDKKEDEGDVEYGEHEGDDSADSDLHSIELNMDNCSRSYKWSYAYGNDVQDDSKRVSVDRVFKGRKSISEKIQWGSICLERRASDSMDLDFHPNSQENSDGFDRERLAELASQTQSQEYEDEIKRYKSVKSLRNHILSGSKVTSVQSFASPTRQWGQSLPLQDQSSPVLQGDDLKPKVAGTRGECRLSTSSRQ